MDPSAYSIKPFNQVNQNQMEKHSFRTPEAAAATNPYSQLDDSKTNFQSMKVQRRGPSCAFLWKGEPREPPRAKATDEPRKVLFSQGQAGSPDENAPVLNKLPLKSYESDEHHRCIDVVNNNREAPDLITDCHQ